MLGDEVQNVLLVMRPPNPVPATGKVNIIVFGDPTYQGRGMNALIVPGRDLRKLNDGFFLSADAGRDS